MNSGWKIIPEPATADYNTKQMKEGFGLESVIDIVGLSNICGMICVKSKFRLAETY